MRDINLKSETDMNIKIGLTNRYGYELIAYPFNGGAYPQSGERIAPLEGKGEVVVASGESVIIDVPGIGALLVQFLGVQKLENLHDKHCETPSEFDKYEQMALLRYKTTELYWRFASSDDAAQLELSVNDIGTVCLDKVLSGEARRISLPEFFIPPVFLPDGVTVQQVNNE
jgi:hypothetical protein|tara:strand:- start:701 stop:1213 length:513 start_codon:yes stop_codon:yes gene_type:complete